MSGVTGVFAVIGASIVAIILVGGFVAYMLQRQEAKLKALKKQVPGEEIRLRLDGIDARLNDLQEIVLALDERTRRDRPDHDLAKG